MTVCGKTALILALMFLFFVVPMYFIFRLSPGESLRQKFAYLISDKNVIFFAVLPLGSAIGQLTFKCWNQGFSLKFLDVFSSAIGGLAGGTVAVFLIVWIKWRKRT